MKTTFIFLTSFFMLLAGCSSSQNTASKGNMQVVEATFNPWTEPPPAGSDIPEKGIDLRVTVQNWPQGYTPDYIVHNQRRSLTASIADSTGNTVVITGSIIRASSVLAETSKSVDTSDRLVFMDPDGKTGFIEIGSWASAEH